MQTQTTVIDWSLKKKIINGGKCLDYRSKPVDWRHFL